MWNIDGGVPCSSFYKDILLSAAHVLMLQQDCCHFVEAILSACESLFLRAERFPFTPQEGPFVMR